jgi:uncharacterized protein
MPPLALMFKTVSSSCNLDCSYCYYRESLEGERVHREVDRAVLSSLIPQYLRYVADTGYASIGWQGGEPTLVGLDLFRWLMELEGAHAPAGMIVSNTLQTNGVLIDDEWAQFLAAYHFLVGVSLDGPEPVHDSVRTTRTGRGTFQRVMRGIEHLRRHQAAVNILCVIGPHNIGDPEGLLRFFRNEGFRYIQLLPAMDFQATDAGATARHLISAEAYGNFLCRTFDEWWNDGLPTISVLSFDALLQALLNLPQDLCIHAPQCSSALVVEWNGDTYPCDFFIHDDHYLGNALETPLAALANHATRARFIQQKQSLSEECAACRWRQLCHGGCPRNRVGMEGTPEVFCQSYRMLFEHAGERLEGLAKRVQRVQRVRELSLQQRRGLQRNQPCPCGSGRKLKACCGDPRLEGSYLFATV